MESYLLLFTQCPLLCKILTNDSKEVHTGSVDILCRVQPISDAVNRRLLSEHDADHSDLAGARNIKDRI